MIKMIVISLLVICVCLIFAIGKLLDNINYLEEVIDQLTNERNKETSERIHELTEKMLFEDECG